MTVVGDVAGNCLGKGVIAAVAVITGLGLALVAAGTVDRPAHTSRVADVGWNSATASQS